MNILVNGSNGFIAKNLIQFLSEQDDINVLCFNRSSSQDDLKKCGYRSRLDCLSLNMSIVLFGRSIDEL